MLSLLAFGLSTVATMTTLIVWGRPWLILMGYSSESAGSAELSERDVEERKLAGLAAALSVNGMSFRQQDPPPAPRQNRSHFEARVHHHVRPHRADQALVAVVLVGSGGDDSICNSGGDEVGCSCIRAVHTLDRPAWSDVTPYSHDAGGS
jgi:hypothetical protein